MTASVSVFTYGTLSIAAIMSALTGRDLASEAAVLHGYERFLLTGRPYPGIVPAPHARTAGRIYRDLDPPSLAILDLFEGDTYERREIEASAASGATLRAHAYIVPARLRHLLSSRPWNEADFLTRHAPRYLERCRAFGIQERARLARREG